MGEIEELKGNLLKIFGKKSDVIIENPADIIYERFSSGSLLLDRVLKGGHVKGTAIEIFGQTGSGKTTSAIHAVAEHQKKYPDEVILWIDIEKTFDPIYFQTIGINLDPDKFILLRPSKGEDAWEAMITMMRDYGKGVIVLDSVATLMNAKEYEGEVGDAQMAGAARMNSQGWRKILPFLRFGGTTLISINQMRTNIGGYGDPNVTTGGKAWAYYARTRIQASVSKGVEELYGKHKFKLIKATFGHKDATVETAIYYGEGINKYRELIDMCIEKGIIKQGGSWFSYGETKLGQGKDSVVDLLQDNLELSEELENKLLEKYKENANT